MKPRGARGTRGVPRAFVAVAGLCVTCASCAAPLLKLPAGPGAPAPDAVDALTQATAPCRAVRTLSADVGISGSAGGRRVRGRLSAGVARPDSVRLEALAPFGAPAFIFVAVKDDATLLLPRDDRVLEHGRPSEVLDAVAGVPLDAANLVTTVIGCAPAGAESDGRGLGADWRSVRVTGGDASYELYLHRDGSALPWRLVATIRQGQSDSGWRAEYRDFQDGLPRSIHLKTTTDRRPDAFDLTLAMSQVETNVALGPEVFRVEIPRTAESITVDELRRARPGIREN